MSASSPDIWYGIGVAIAGLVATLTGLRYGGGKREDTAERVIGLAIAGGVYQTGQVALGRQNVGDIVKATKELMGAVKHLANVETTLAESSAHFDETTEREARDKTIHKLDDLNEAIRDLRKEKPAGCVPWI